MRRLRRSVGGSGSMVGASWAESGGPGPIGTGARTHRFFQGGCGRRGCPAFPPFTESLPRPYRPLFGTNTVIFGQILPVRPDFLRRCFVREPPFQASEEFGVFRLLFDLGNEDPWRTQGDFFDDCIEIGEAFVCDSSLATALRGEPLCRATSIAIPIRARYGDLHDEFDYPFA